MSLKNKDYGLFGGEVSGGCGGTGTVTLVAACGFGGIVICGSPITSAGTLCIYGNQIMIPDSGCASTIRCGVGNCASGNYSAALSGCCNISNKSFSFVGGGAKNTSSGYYSTISGGYLNTASARYGTVSGGYHNINNGFASTISGGYCNTISGDYSTASGYRNTISASIGGTVFGGSNTVSSNYGTVSGGRTNTASGYRSVVSGGNNNVSSGTKSVVSGGEQNTSSGCYSGILSGCCNNICGYCKSMILGSNICANAICTAFVNNLNIVNTPTCDTSITQILGRDTTSGQVKYVPYLPTANYGLFAQTGNSPVITATTTESTLIDSGVGSLSVPANAFKVGDSFVASMSGLMSAKNNDTITIRVKSGSVVLADSGALTLPTISNQVWSLGIEFTIRTIGGAGVASIVTLGQLHVLKFASGTQEGFGFNTVNNTTFDTTTSNTLNITAQWSSNSPLNSIYSDLFVLNKSY